MGETGGEEQAKKGIRLREYSLTTPLNRLGHLFHPIDTESY